MMKLLDRLLDKSIYFSFDRTGFERHAKKFQDEIFCGEGKVAVVTGANSGLGFAVTRALCRYGVKVYMLCRSEKRGREAKGIVLQEIPGAQIELACVNVSEPKSVEAFLQREDLPDFDIVVNNAGGMPEQLTLNSEGNEIVWQSHLVGHFLLVRGVIARGKILEGGRVITVSSGGMYSQKLDLSDLQFEANEYNKYVAYANAKRAQVILNELWQEHYANRYSFACMHPGWADTQGVRKAMPWFYWWMKKRLRTVDQGADTVVWLALTQERYPGGRFWFDRNEAPTHFRNKTRETDEQRQQLWKVLMGE